MASLPPESARTPRHDIPRLLFRPETGRIQPRPSVIDRGDVVMAEAFIAGHERMLCSGSLSVPAGGRLIQGRASGRVARCRRSGSETWPRPLRIGRPLVRGAYRQPADRLRHAPDQPASPETGNRIWNFAGRRGGENDLISICRARRVSAFDLPIRPHDRRQVPYAIVLPESGDLLSLSRPRERAGVRADPARGTYRINRGAGPLPTAPRYRTAARIAAPRRHRARPDCRKGEGGGW